MEKKIQNDLFQIHNLISFIVSGAPRIQLHEIIVALGLNQLGFYWRD